MFSAGFFMGSSAMEPATYLESDFPLAVRRRMGFFLLGVKRRGRGGGVVGAAAGGSSWILSGTGAGA